MEYKNFVINENNVEEYVNKISNWIKTRVESANSKGVVLGMSSGVDCSVVARLCQIAKINTHLILMPYGESMSKTESYTHAMELINKFEFKYSVFDIKPAVDALKIEEDSTKLNLAQANIRPRVRMTYLYQYAQINDLLVIGTGNLSERTIGYFTKWGDGGCDLNPIANITKREVYVLAKYLNVPEGIINKKPSAELWEGQNDEDEIGISYDMLDEYILNGTSGDVAIDKLIENKKQRAMHKLNPISTFN